MIPTLRDNRSLRLAILCLLYLAQGLPYGFVTVALAAHLAAQGATAATIGGVIAMAVLPWSFKWAWGPVVDSGRWAALGRRRPWIMLAQTAMIASAALLGMVPADNVALLGWVVLVHNVFVGLQDVAVDSLAVDMLEGADRERASGMMYGASYLGTFLGGAGLGIVTARMGLTTAIAVLACGQAAILATVIAIRERPGDLVLPWPGRRPRAAEPSTLGARGVVGIGRALARGMTRRPAALAASAAFLMKVLPATIAVMMMVELIEKNGWSQERFSTVTGGGGVLLGLVASVVGGFVSSWVGPRPTAIVANLLLGLTWLVFAAMAPHWSRSDVVFAWIAADTICQAITTVSLFAIFMRVASPAVAATQFTASMAIMNLATSLGSWLAGPIGMVVDTQTLFVIAGFLQPCCGLLLPHAAAAHPLQTETCSNDQPAASC